MSGVNFTIYNLISIVTCFVGLLYAFQIGTLKKTKSAGNKYFTWYLIVLSLIVFVFFIIDIKIAHGYGIIAIIVTLIPSIVLIAPLIWLYIRGLITDRKRKKAILHFLPAIISGILILVLGILLMIVSDKSSKSLIISLLKYICVYGMIVFFIIQNIFYITKIIKDFRKHRRKIEEIYSYSEEVDLSWVKVLIIGYIPLILGIIIVNFLTGAISNILFSLIILAYIIYTGHNAMKQKTISALELSDGNEAEDEKDKNVSNAQLLIFKKIKEDLMEVMKTEKPYLDHNLNIFTLSKRLNTNSKYLSQVINMEFNKSFVHFINEYRIEEAKQILLLNNNYTIEAQSQMVGFKSKSSFNIAFKRHTGLTPTLFIQGNR